MTINFIQRKSFKQKVWKTLNVIVGVTTILNVSLGGALINPKVALADAPSPSGTIAVSYDAATGALSASGQYAWTACNPSNSNRIVGFALFIDGPDADSNIGTPLVNNTEALEGAGMHLANSGNPCTATPGSWSDNAHDSTTNPILTAAPSKVCAVFYDVRSGDTSGSHSQIGAGSNRNTDNSYEQNDDVYASSACVVPTIANSGTISGLKFNDLNGNGSQDSGEAGLQNWTIYLDQNHNGSKDASEVSAITDANGNYQLTSLAAGSYRVREVQQVGWTQTSANPADINLAANQNVTGVDFGNHQNQCVLTVTKKVNGVTAPVTANPGDTITYRIDVTNDGTANCTGGGVKVTDVVDAQLTFTGETHSPNVLPGYPGPSTAYNSSNRTISWNAQTLTPGQSAWVQWTATVRPSACGDFDIPNIANVYANQYNNMQTPVPSNTVHVTGTKVCQGTISGMKFNDLNGNGAQDTGEPGLSGWTIQLKNTSDVVLDSAVTDGSGHYSFAATAPATYRLREVGQGGWVQTTSNPGDVSLTIGQNVTNVNFGNFQKGSISGQKYNDLNGNGSQNAGESGLAGWTIQLDKQPFGSVDANAVTDVNGNYSFTNLGLGTYRLREVNPLGSGWTQTSANPADITVSSGTNVSSIDFGNHRDTGDLKVIKHVINDNGGRATASNFTMHIKQSNVDVVTPFTGSATGTTRTLITGTYNVNESGLPTGYVQTSIVCDGQATSSVTVVAGQTKVCTVTNNDIQPKLTVTKVVVNNNGGTKVVADFPLFVNASPVTSGAQNDFNVGTYVVNETSDPGYAATITGDCDSQGNVTLNPGDVKSCTITNNDVAPTITLIKHVINDNGGNAGPNDFELIIGGTMVNSGQTLPVDANTQIALDETGLTGYAFVSITGDKGCPEELGDTVTLNEGENLTCTITNNDIAPTITLIKNVVNNNGGNAGPNDFGLTIDEIDVDSGQPLPVDANTPIELSEAGLPGYEFVSISGDKGCPEELGDTVTLDAGDNLTCTITNDDIQPRLVVTKIVINSNGSSASPSDFTMHVDGENASPASFPGSDNGTLVTLDQGTYSVTEDSLGGFDPVFSSDCTGSIVVGATKYCTVTNTAQGPYLLVIKTIVNDNGGHNVESDFTMNVTAENPWPSSFPGNPVGTLVELDLGQYNVDETGPAGYAKTLSPDCAGTIATGEIKICEITNNDIAPTITLIKNVVNNNGGNAGPNDFGLTIDEVDVDSGQPLPVDANTPIELSEAGLPGYEFVSISGDKGCPEELGDTVTLDAGDNLTCTITNDDIQPRLVVTKIVINDNGGSKQVADFVLFVDLTPVTSGVQNSFNAGSYVVSEASIPGYNATISGDCTVDGSVTLGSGDVKSCTITNDDIQPKLTVTKVVVNDNGGTKVVADFPLFVNASPVTSGVQNGFSTGQYIVSETTDPDYTSSISDDCDANGSITLNPGDVKSCTITNNDQAAHLVVIKHVVNNEGGTKTAADFTLTINDVTVPSGATFVGAEHPGVDKIVHPGTYSVTETPVVGYAASFSPDCSGTIALGETKTCTVTNDDIKPVIAIDKTGPATVNTGDNITYTLAWAVGAAPVTNAVISDTTPTNTSFVSAGCGTTSGTCIVNAATSTVSWNLDRRNPGESGTVTLTVKTNSPLTNGTVITNTGTFDTDQTEPVSDTVTTTVLSLPVLGLQKSASPTTVPAGQTVNWTVRWSVAGNAVATNVVIVDPIPANSAFVSVADGGVYDPTTNKITWNVGPQSPGASGEVHYVARTANPIPNGTVITNTASIDSAETDPPISASASVTVTSAPDLTIAKTNDVATFTNPGKALTYTVVVTNKATATDTAKNVVLTDTLPSGFTFAVDGSTTKSFTIGNLTPGQSATLTYLVNISGPQAAGTYNNLAKAKGDNTNEVTAKAPVEVRVPQILGVETNPDLTITKSVNRKTVKPDDIVTYTMVVKNTGDADAVNVVLTDLLPQHLSFVHSSNQTKTWKIGTLEPGRTRTVDVDVRVDTNAKNGDYVNTATVTADEVPQKEAQAKLTVKKPKVLGLATTGVGMTDYAIALLGLALVLLGTLGILRRQVSKA